MDLDRLFLLFVFVCEGVAGTLINPLSQESSLDVVHCLASNAIIQIKDPFQASRFNDDKFISMEWYKYTNNRTTEVQLLKFLKTEQPRPGNSKYNSFEFWGLQINNVEPSDSAEYTAKLVTTGPSPVWSVNIEVASPPELTSEKLAMSQTVNEVDNSVSVSCGQVASLGSPPLAFMLKAGNGTVLPTVYRDGFIELTLSSKEAEFGKFSCEINMSAPAARCIKDTDLARWKGAITDTSRISAAGSNMIGIIAGVVAAVVVLIIIIIIIVFILRKRKMKSKTYNAKTNETKRDGELNQEKGGPLLNDYENPYDKPSVTRTPIYKGPNVPSPYMVSKLDQAGDNADEEYEEMAYPNGDSSPPRTTSGKFVKKREEKDKRQTEKDRNKDKSSGKEGTKDEKPPRAKPRSIFLTPSMEELDKITKAVASGGDSGANGGIGTRV